MHASTSFSVATRFTGTGRTRQFSLPAVAVAVALCACIPAQAQTALAAVPAGSGAAQPQVGPDTAAQSAYLAGLRRHFLAAAHYPTGREASLQRPQGDVTVRFELDRHGAVRQASVVRSSNSMLLDGAALSTVRRGDFGAFPDGLYAGEASHAFTVTLAYARDVQQQQQVGSRLLVQSAVVAPAAP